MRSPKDNYNGGGRPGKRARGDKQLCDIDFAEVVEQERTGQALDRKRFARRAGISYSKARQWFNTPGFPCFDGVVFWEDFVHWRNVKTGVSTLSAKLPQHPLGVIGSGAHLSGSSEFPPRSARILEESETGNESRNARGPLETNDAENNYNTAKKP
jgi:hypothetical protein